MLSHGLGNRSGRPTERRELSPKQVTADCLYGSDENCEKAKSIGVKVISPTKSTGSEKDGTQLKDFEFEQDGHVRCCPQGHAPVIKKKKKTRFTLGFALEACSQCPLVLQRPAKEGKKYYCFRLYLNTTLNAGLIFYETVNS